MVADEAGAVHKETMSLPTRHLPTLMAAVAVLVVVPLAPGAVRVAEVAEGADEEDGADGVAMLPLPRNLRIRFRI